MVISRPIVGAFLLLGTIACGRPSDPPSPGSPPAPGHTDAGFAVRAAPPCDPAVGHALVDVDPNAIRRVNLRVAGIMCRGSVNDPWPLDIAVLSDRPARVRAVLEMGADTEARWSSHGDRFPLQEVTECSLYPEGPCSNALEMVTLLLEYGANPDARFCPFESRTPAHDGSNPCRSNVGWTPLMAAAALGESDMVRALLDAGADTELRDGADKTARDYAKGGAVAVLQK
jgi:Ankyrin repeats (many copies)